MKKKQSLSRRDFLKSSVLGAAALAGTGLLAGCTPKIADSSEPTATSAPEQVGTTFDSEFSQLFTESSAEIEPISNASDGGEFDIIVIGAGTSGVPCAVKAYQDGAKVLLLQKEPTAVAQGNSCTGMILEESSPSALRYFINLMQTDCDHRSDPEQVKVYVNNSGEATKWYLEEVNASGYKMEATPSTKDYGDPFGKLVTITARTVKPDNQGTAIKSVMAAYKDKIDVKYETPAVQLIKEGNRVTGVYTKDSSGAYYKFTATKGVVVATGDYQNNEAMVERFCPDVKPFGKKQYNKTGDGQLMGILAGAVMEPVGHTKMLHDFDSGPMGDEPFLRVDLNGKRFLNEEVTLPMVNNYLRKLDASKAGKYCQIFDSDYVAQAKEWGGRPTDEINLELYMPEVAMAERVGVREDLIATFKAETLEELAGKLEIPADTLIATVNRYNELVDQGSDEDFGKAPKYLKKIEKTPFYGIRKGLRVSALCSGILINKDFEVLDSEQKPIENLYAIGNCSGQFYGGPDYPMLLGGMSVGRCVTAGFVLGKSLAAK